LWLALIVASRRAIICSVVLSISMVWQYNNKDQIQCPIQQLLTPVCHIICMCDSNPTTSDTSFLTILPLLLVCSLPREHVYQAVCLAVNVYFGSTILAFRHHVTIHLIIPWNVDLLLDNDRERSSYAITVTE
jgi:hypothetical protein